MNSTKTIFRTLAATGCLTLALGVTACSGELDGVGEGVKDVAGMALDNAKNADSNPDAETTQAQDLNVGDCLYGQQGVSIDTVEVIDCAQPHHAELFHKFNLDLPEYDMTGISEQADAVCTAEFEKFVGVPFDSSSLSLTWFEPSMGTWGDGDREVMCLVEDSMGGLEGSMAGTAR